MFGDVFANNLYIFIAYLFRNLYKSYTLTFHLKKTSDFYISWQMDQELIENF